MEYEELMLNLLKQEAGLNQVSQMTKMMADIKTSKELVTAFRQSRAGLPESGVDFTAEVLQSGVWTSKQIAVELPRELQVCQADFESFYETQHKRRVLKWLYNYGSVEVHTTHTPKRFQLITNVAQAAILCHFNEGDVLTVGEIIKKTHLKEQNLRQALFALCHPKKGQVLKKQNMKKVSFEDMDEAITLNYNIKSQNIRLSLVP